MIAYNGKSISKRLWLGVQCLVVMMVVAGLSACEDNHYSTGDGANSYLQARFGEVHTTAKGTLAYVVTDEGDTLRIADNIVNKSLAVADSVYRVLYYYDQNGKNVNPRSIVALPVVQLSTNSKLETDPVTFESAWVSKNRKYFNIGFALKVGRSDGQDKKQRIGVVRDSLVRTPSGQHILYMHLVHSQNGVPQYYSQSYYISIPLKSLPTNTRFVFRVKDYREEVTIER
jgi:lipoprotein